MEPVIPYSFELALAMPNLSKWTDTYSICNNHREHNHNARSNEYPFIRFDFREQLWGKLPDDQYDLETRVLEKAYDEFSECYQSDDAEKEHGFKMCFDINGYRLLALVPTESLWEERAELEEQFQEMQDEIDSGEATIREYIDEMEGIKVEVEEIDEKLVKCMTFLEYFKECAESFKHWFDEHVVVFSGDLHDAEFDFVDRDWYEEMKEEYGWKLWDFHNHIEETADEASLELIEDSVKEEICINAPDTNEEMQQIVCNTIGG